MAEKETKNKPKDLIEAVPEELAKIDVEKEIDKAVGVVEEARPEKWKRKSREEMAAEKAQAALNAWVPKTKIGRLVREGKEKNFDKLLETHKKILESEVADLLLHLESDLLLVGQAKGKFGGGKRRAWGQTQKKTMEGNVVTFSCLAVVGDKKGHVGVGLGKAKETLPSREKALRAAKLNIVKITLGNETPGDAGDKHTVPFAVEGKCGSVRIKFLPAPRGTGLVAGDEAKKILRLAGIKDIYCVSDGQTGTTINLAFAVVDALTKTNRNIA